MAWSTDDRNVTVFGLGYQNKLVSMCDPRLRLISIMLYTNKQVNDKDRVHEK